MPKMRLFPIGSSVVVDGTRGIATVLGEYNGRIEVRHVNGVVGCYKVSALNRAATDAMLSM